MFECWRHSRWFVQMPLHDGPAADGDFAGGPGDLAGGDEDAHPEYDVDLGDGTDDDPSAAAQPGARPPRAPVQQPAQGGTPGAGPDTRSAITPEQYNQVVTGYQTMERNFAALQAQNQLLQRQVAALTGVRPPEPASSQDPPLSEADQKAVAAVYRLFPKLRPLLEKADALLGIPDTVKRFETEAESRWTDIGTRMWDAFDKAVGEAYGGNKLHPFAQKALDAAFIAWLETDKNAAARYRMGDMTLSAEFLRMYKSGVIVPAQRAGNGQPPRTVGGRPSGQQPPRVPRGGPGQPATGQRPAQPNAKNPDEVHEAAADAFFAARS